MPSPYTAGALEARDIAEATDVTVANLSEAASIAAAAGVNVTDVNTASTFAGLIADDTGELLVGVQAKATNSTTIVIAHSFAAAPDFVMITPILKLLDSEPVTIVANTTSVTYTKNTTATSWSVAYILGYTA